MGKHVYIISGPAGAGKSTTSKKIAARLNKSAHIEGDRIDHMVVGGHEKPWLSQYHTDLIWLNILALAKNFIEHGYDVVIDYVAFMKNARFIRNEFSGMNVSVKFVVLTTDETELLRRDSERILENQMGYRCIAGLQEIKQSNPPENHVIDSTNLDVETVVDEIMSNARFYL